PPARHLFWHKSRHTRVRWVSRRDSEPGPPHLTPTLSAPRGGEGELVLSEMAIGRPRRWISHSSKILEVSWTRRRTSSPRSSRSAAVAVPVLIRKLVCC